MASRRRDPWAVRRSAIPAPVDQRADTYFGFVPSENRRPVPSADPLVLSVVRLLAYRVGEGTPRKAGTGIVIGPDTLVTVAHNLFDPTNSGFGTQRKGYAMSIQVVSDHVGVPKPMTTRFVAPPGYTASADRGADIAVVKLDAAFTSAQPLFLGALTDQQTQNMPILVYGYPELTPQLYSGRGVCVAARPGALFHTADAAEGESGGPLLVNHGTGLSLAGLHRAGPAETPGDVPPSCGAVRLVDGAIAWIRQVEGQL